MGFDYDRSTGVWSADDVTDEHFCQFGGTPPDVLGDETKSDWTDTLTYLHEKLGLANDDDGKLAESLNTLIETLHGVEMTRIQTADENDHSFHKRVAVAQWLHLKGGF